MRFTRLPAASLLIFVALVSRVTQSPAQAPDSTGTLAVVVTVKETNEPLGFSSVGIPARQIERLANDRGVVTITNLAPGRVDILVRHVGFTPANAVAQIHARGTDTLRVALTHAAVALSAVEVQAARTCTRPGRPVASLNPAFAAVFTQLEINASQYRLLSEEYPFTYDVERRSTIRYVGGDEVLQRFDTVRVGTGTRWHYKPGEVVETSDNPRDRQVLFNIPALVHFADSVFLANHCFYSGGRDEIDGSSVIRIDFLASNRISAPDVSGSMYIDGKTYQIRRSILHLTKIPRETPQIESVVVTTDFTTVVPAIAIMRSISSVHQLFTDTTRAVLPKAAYEDQRLLRVEFVRGKP